MAEDDNGQRGYARASSISRLERSLERLEVKLDAHIGTHNDRHEREQRDFNQHLRESATMIDALRRLEIEQGEHNARIAGVEVWRAELRGAFRLGQLAFGTSVLSAVTAIIALIGLLVPHPVNIP